MPSPGSGMIAAKTQLQLTLFVFFKTVLIPLPCLQNLEMQNKIGYISVKWVNG